MMCYMLLLFGDLLYKLSGQSSNNMIFLICFKSIDYRCEISNISNM